MKISPNRKISTKSATVTGLMSPRLFCILATGCMLPLNSFAQGDNVKVTGKFFWLDNSKTKIFGKGEQISQDTKKTKKIEFVQDGKTNELLLTLNDFSKSFEYSGPSQINFFASTSPKAEGGLRAPIFTTNFVEKTGSHLMIYVEDGDKVFASALPLAKLKASMKEAKVGDLGAGKETLLIYNISEAEIQMKTSNGEATIPSREWKSFSLPDEKGSGKGRLLLNGYVKKKHSNGSTYQYRVISRYYKSIGSTSSARVAIISVNRDKFMLNVLPSFEWSVK